MEVGQGGVVEGQRRGWAQRRPRGVRCSDWSGLVGAVGNKVAKASRIETRQGGHGPRGSEYL